MLKKIFLHFFGIFMFLQFLRLLGIYNFQNYVWTSLVYQTCSKVEMFGQNKGTLYVESYKLTTSELLPNFQSLQPPNPTSN